MRIGRHTVAMALGLTLLPGCDVLQVKPTFEVALKIPADVVVSEEGQDCAGAFADVVVGSKKR